MGNFPSRNPCGCRRVASPAGVSPRKNRQSEAGLGLPEWVGLRDHQLPKTSIVNCPRLCSETDTASPHSVQRMAPQTNRVEKIISSNVSPSPSAYHGPPSAMRSRISAAEVSGEAANEQEQLGQKSSTCMAVLLKDRGNCSFGVNHCK